MYMKGEKFFKKGSESSNRIVKIVSENGLKNVALENNLYDPGIPGLSSNDLEEIFRGYGEDFYNDLIASIYSLQAGEEIPDEIKDKICLFIASMRVRTPQFKREIEEIAEVFTKHDMSKKFGSMSLEEIIKFNKEKLNNELTKDEARKIQEVFKEKKYELKYPNGYFIKIALLQLNHFADIYRKMTINIIKSSYRYFITSDNPVVYFVPREKVDSYNSYKSLVSPYSELFFSLSQNLGVTLNWRKMEERIMPENREVIDIFNYNISHNSFDFIFSPLEMNSLNKFVEEYIPYPFKINIH